MEDQNQHKSNQDAEGNDNPVAAILTSDIAQASMPSEDAQFRYVEKIVRVCERVEAIEN